MKQKILKITERELDLLLKNAYLEGRTYQWRELISVINKLSNKNIKTK